MVRLTDVQGRIYRCKIKSECTELGIPAPAILDIVRLDMVLVLGFVPGKKHFVKVMTITSTLKDDSEYVPISPTPKKGYAIQLRLRHHFEWYRGGFERHIPKLEKHSHLKIDSSYELPIQMLDEATDGSGMPLMIYARRQGGLAELQDHIRRCDKLRKEEQICRMIEEQSLEEDNV